MTLFDVGPAMPVKGGRWGIEEWRDDAWRSLTASGAIGYAEREHAEVDVFKLSAGGATCRVVDQGDE